MKRINKNIICWKLISNVPREGYGIIYTYGISYKKFIKNIWKLN